jgi:hypothetical protein
MYFLVSPNFHLKRIFFQKVSVMQHGGYSEIKSYLGNWTFIQFS